MKQVTLFEKVPHYKFIANMIAEGTSINEMLIAFQARFNIELGVDDFITDYLSKIPFSILQEVSASPEDIPIANKIWRLLKYQYLYTRFEQLDDLVNAAKCLQAVHNEVDALQLDLNDNRKLEKEEKKQLSDGFNKVMNMVDAVLKKGF